MSILASLETIDKPLPSEPSSSSSSLPLSSPPLLAFASTSSCASTTSTESSRRVSRLPPTPSLPLAGPSRGPQRFLFVAVRRGHSVGVFQSWSEAEPHVLDHPSPVFKTFSTRLAAEAFIAGWDGAGRHSLPSSSPRPLREHLAMTFPSSVPPPSPPSLRQRPSYHARLLTNLPPLPSDQSVWTSALSPSSDFGPAPLGGEYKRHSASFRHSMVRVSSPLRMQVDEDEASAEAQEREGRLRKVQSLSIVGLGGLLSPPQSPEGDKSGSKVMDRERPTKPRGATESGPWSASPHRQFPAVAKGLGLISPPTSPLAEQRPSLRRPPSGLWADSAPSPLSLPRSTFASPSPASAPPPPDLELPSSSAPKFSRSALKKNGGIVMPVAAPRSKSSSSLRSSLLGSPASSSSTLSLTSSASTIRRATSRASPSASQDRLSSLAETSKRELQLNEEGLSALDALSPPRPAFMRRTPSNSSLASSSSMSSLTSASSSNITSSYESCDTIPEHEEGALPVQVVVDEGMGMSCTRSDGDAESSSTKSGGEGGKKTKRPGGLFKRFSRVLGREKKIVPGQDGGRRGSL